MLNLLVSSWLAGPWIICYAATTLVIWWAHSWMGRTFYTHTHTQKWVESTCTQANKQKYKVPRERRLNASVSMCLVTDKSQQTTRMAAVMKSDSNIQSELSQVWLESGDTRLQLWAFSINGSIWGYRMNVKMSSANLGKGASHSQRHASEKVCSHYL